MHADVLLRLMVHFASGQFKEKEEKGGGQEKTPHLKFQAVASFYRGSHSKLLRIQLWAKIGCCGAKFFHEHVLGSCLVVVRNDQEKKICNGVILRPV